MSSISGPAASAPATTAAPATSAAPSSPSPVSTSPPTTTPATTPSSSSISSVNSSPSSSSSSTSSTRPSSDTSSTAPTTTSSPKTSSTSSISFIVGTSNGQVFTQTSVITVPASTATQTPAPQSSTSFFHNTGAVAGVFSVVGVISLVAIFFLLTSFIRRRRARKFDREIDEAAAAAANAQAPDFDDYDYTSGTGVGYGPYSETSHGTYNQPPLSHEPSHNNLADIPVTSYEAYSGGGGPGSGAAGIGARGRSQRGGTQPDPYGALANPPEQYEMYETRRSWNQGNPRGGPGVPTYDLLQAAGLSSSDPYAVTRAASTRLPYSQSQSGIPGLTRSQSQGTSTLPTTAESYPMPTPAPTYPGAQDTQYPPEKTRYSASYVPGGGVTTMPPIGDEDVYGGYQDQLAPLDNPHSPGIGPEHEEVTEQYEDGPRPREPEEPARVSIADDEDYGYNSGRRVLRVANE